MTYKQSLNIQNFQLGEFEQAGRFGIPPIIGIEQPVEKCQYLGFGEKVADPDNYGCHFFLDDYRFQRVWNNPSRYIETLRRFKYVLAPDFSLFLDYPKALCIYNQFRKHWCARFWQENNIPVIPVIRWMYEDSYDWCFDGEPHGSVVAVSSTGICNNRAMIDMFSKGFQKMQEVLCPIQILWFGKFILEEKPENVMLCETTMVNRIKLLRENHAKEGKDRGRRL